MDFGVGRCGDEPSGEIIWLFDADAAPHTDPCSPTELFGRLDRAAVTAGLSSVAVRGCVRGVRRRGRICTFELTDDTADRETAPALVRVVVFPQQLRALDRAAAEAGRVLEDGADATVAGAVRFDPAYGSVRIVADTVVVHEGAGEHAQRSAELLAQLDREGVFTRNAALVVPGRPLRIGLITSPGTAGDADVSALLEASGIEWQLLRQAVPMAGSNAPAAVAAAITRLAQASPMTSLGGIAPAANSVGSDTTATERCYRISALLGAVLTLPVSRVARTTPPENFSSEEATTKRAGADSLPN